MKRARTILAVVLALVMVLSLIPVSFADNASVLRERVESRKDQYDGQRTTMKDKRSYVKDKENLGNFDVIDPEAEVTAIVIFDEPALLDTYTAEEVRAKKTNDVRERMSSAHDVFFKNLSFEAKRMYDYTALINGMSLKTAYKNLAVMEKMDGVQKVFVANEYNAPVVQQPEMEYANIITGAYSMQTIGYKGKGMVVAVLDTGLNLTHEAFQDYGLITDPALTEEDVENAWTYEYGQYISAKIPFAYDYYDGDDDVTDYNGHGTHVSGTIAGFAMDEDGAVKFSGAAPEAQIVFMKIFADQTNGTNSGIYMEALEDCFWLGVDAINMSIGSPSGFVYDYELEDYFGNVYAKLDQAGIMTCVAAGNEYSMAYNAANFAGNGYVLADFADYGTVASPSTYAGNISVASMENTNYPSLAIEYNGKAYGYTDNCDDDEHGWLDNFGGQELELVYCGKGNPDEIPDEVEGKIALVVRGDITFSEKNKNVADKDAIGMILFNNTSGMIGMLIDTYYVPAISITMDAGVAILNGIEENNTITVTTEEEIVDNPSAWLMSSFSNWGCTPNLQLKPTISAPGGMIYSAVAGASDAYEVYSGTSMATPNTCGSFTLLLQYIKETYPSLSKVQRAELAEDLMESTAMLPQDADGYLYSPRKSGAGILNLENALSAPVYFVEPIINLYDDPEKTGVYTMRYTAVNLTDVDQVYDVEVIGLYDYVTQGYNTLTSDYLFDGEGITVEGETKITVPANGTYDGKLKITLDEDAKAYFDQTFANGNFFEGYIYFTNEDPFAGNGSAIVVGTLGDANLDGKITAADAAEILRAVVGLTELSDEAKYYADVNQDGEVTAADAAYLLRAVVGMEVLPDFTPTNSDPVTDVHLTFMGFYGDWKQAPVLDRTWSIDPDYMQAYIYELLYYPQYYQLGYLPIDLFPSLETNIAVTDVYGGYYSSGLHASTYFGWNPMAFNSSYYDYTDYEDYYTEEEFEALETFLEDFDTELLLDVYSGAGEHYTITTDDGYDSYNVNEMMISAPIQLRNARHLIMTVSDAETGEIYYVDDTEYLGKAYYDSDYGWGARGSFYWDGYVENEESDLYGWYVPSGTVVNVTYETMVDYPGAELNKEYEFQMLVDYDSPVIADSARITEGDKEYIVIHMEDEGGSGMASAVVYAENEEGAPIFLDYGVGEEANELIVDVSEIPEGADFLYIDAMDYASNWPDFTIMVATGEDVYMVDEVWDMIMNEKELDKKVAVVGIVNEIYKDTVYVMGDWPYYDDAGFGLAIKLADPEALEEIKIGDEWLFIGETDNYYGCPTLVNAELIYCAYENTYLEDDPSDPGLYTWIYQYYGDVPYDFYLEDIMADPSRFVGGLFELDYLLVTGVTELGDGTRTITITDGYSAIDIVATSTFEDVDYHHVISGFFTVVFDYGTPQLRVLLDNDYWTYDMGPY